MDQDTNIAELINTLNDDERQAVSWVVAAVEVGAMCSEHADLQAWYELLLNDTTQ